MSETGHLVIPSQTETVLPQKTVKVLKIWQLILFTILLAVILYLGGATIGNLFFWKQYDRTPLEERQYNSALEKVKINPKSANNHVELGWALFQKDQYNEALAEYQKALDLDNNNYMANLNLGLTYRQVNKDELAISSFQKTVEIAPNSFEAHYYLGLAYQQTGKLQDALEELQLAYKLNPGSTEIIYNIGQCYEKMGKLEDAKTQYQADLEFDPKFIRAKDALKRLGVQ